MEQEQITESFSADQTESGFKKHFCSVTPLSKFLALALFVALPFVGFWVGVKYQQSETVENVGPTLVTESEVFEIVPEKEVTSVEEFGNEVVEINENVGIGEIMFQAEVFPGGQDSCPVDGVCSMIIGRYEVEWMHGRKLQPELRGTVGRNIDEGDVVAVYGKVVKDPTITIYGSEEYYIAHACPGPKCEQDVSTTY